MLRREEGCPKRIRERKLVNCCPVSDSAHVKNFWDSSLDTGEIITGLTVRGKGIIIKVLVGVSVLY